MNILHRGFDRLELAIEANISQELFESLSVERERAEEERQPVEVSWAGLTFSLLPHGGNGYRFILDSGPLGLRWFFKKPNRRDPWGIRLTVGSTVLATQGLGHVRALINNDLERLGIAHEAHQVSLARVDFCVDVLAPGFELEPEQFVIHSHANRRDFQSAVTEEDRQSNGKSGRYTSVTVGKMPGRQVILYDKRREVIETHKPIWWHIWNANLRGMGLPELDPKDRQASRVWRIEVRAGKSLLKDRWQVRSWADLDGRFGDIVEEIFQKVRYCAPASNDSNRSRWPNHPIWDMAAHAATDDLAEMRSYLEPAKVKAVYRAEQARVIAGLVYGNAITLAALEEVSQAELPGYLASIGKQLRATVAADPDRAANKLGKAWERYRFI